MIERWQPLGEYSDKYEVSNLGRVRSIDRYVKGRRGGIQFKHGKLLQPKITRRGYVTVHIRNGGTNQYPLVHRLVASAFVPSDVGKAVVNHKDGNKLNNRADNLEWCTSAENSQHALLNNLTPSGERSHNAKLSYNDVLQIKREYIRGSKNFGVVALAAKYGISKSMVSLIVRGEKWKYAG